MGSLWLVNPADMKSHIRTFARYMNRIPVSIMCIGGLELGAVIRALSLSLIPKFVHRKVFVGRPSTKLIISWRLGRRAYQSATG